jgi:CBS domain-containing protein
MRVHHIALHTQRLAEVEHFYGELLGLPTGSDGRRVEPRSYPRSLDDRGREEPTLKPITAREVMTREVLSVRADWSATELAAFFIDHSISGAPVLDAEGKPMGVVSLTDLARDGTIAQVSPPEPHGFYRQALERAVGCDQAARLRMAEDSATMVRDLMTPMVFSVQTDTPVQEVADTMIRGRIHRVFVVDGETMVGVISAIDLLPLIRDL